jgi:hypothetical protein
MVPGAWGGTGMKNPCFVIIYVKKPQERLFSVFLPSLLMEGRLSLLLREN